MNPSLALATVLVDELVRSGVREAVLCPGSRSAPLAYALHDADRAGRLRLHVRVDERSAGFLALGLAKLARVPTVVVTTSGTAVANLHPAVLEAHHGQVPLIVLSADRPPELRGTGANQTTVQPGIFPAALRLSLEVGAPEARAGQNAAWRSTVCRAVAAAVGALGSQPGPVHLNVPLREPLVPTGGDPSTWPESLEGRANGAPWVSAGGARRPPSGGLPAVERGVARTLVVIGDLPEARHVEDALAWARRHGWPVVAEPFGPHPRPGAVPHGSLLLTVGDWLDAHAPERVITVGRITLSRAVARLLRRPGVRVESVTATDQWSDASHVVSRVHGLDVLGDDAPGEVDASYAQAWEEAGAAIAKAVADDPLPWPTGLGVAHILWRYLPSGAMLFAGSSNAVRDLDLAAPGVGEDVTVLANRGLAGIDGCVSTAVGIALAAGSPAYALLGDLTFLHDANGLLVGPAEPYPDLTIVVVNDDGGGIFTLLEPGDPELAGRFERVFGTPTGTDLAALCAAHGVRHVLASTAQQLADAVATAPRGVAVVEVRVDRAGHRSAQARLRATAARATTAQATTQDR